LLTLILLGLPILVQIYIWLTYGGVNDHLNVAGGIDPLNHLLLVLCLIVSFSFFLFGKFKELSHVFAASTLGVTLLSGLIYTYQFMSAQAENYYSIKIGHLAFLILFLFAASAAVAGANNVAHIPRANFLLLLITLGIFIPQATGINMDILAYAKGGSRKLSSYSAAQVMGLAGSKANLEANVVMFKELDYEEDIITTHFIDMLSRTDPDCQHNILNSMIVRKRQQVVDGIAACSNEQNKVFTVISSSHNFQELTEYYRVKAPLVHVILSN
jgi:hypothetical protein